MHKLLFLSAIMMMTAACGTNTGAQTPQADNDIVRAAATPAGVGQQRALPKATVYRTNVPCPDNVVISLNADRNAVLSYPAPTDVSEASAPLPLADGWWLDRRGIGPNPAFISMTYSRYAALKQPPTTAELMHMILPDVRVTEVRRLDMTPQQAAEDTAAVNALLRKLP